MPGTGDIREVKIDMVSAFMKLGLQKDPCEQNNQTNICKIINVKSAVRARLLTKSRVQARPLWDEMIAELRSEGCVRITKRKKKVEGARKAFQAEGTT